MRSFFLLITLWIAGVLSASSKKFKTLHSKSFPIRIDDKTFKDVTGQPRDYATMVLLTAMESKFGCKACQDFSPEWKSLSSTWQRNDKGGESGLVFAELDFANGRDTFMSLQLQHAPVLMLYLPTEGPNAKPDGQPIRFDFIQSAPTAEALRDWIARHLPESNCPKYTRPFNWLKLGIFSILSIGALTLIIVIAPHIAPIVQNRNVWAAISLLSVLLFTSGHMYNHIRKVPYVAGDGKGGVQYFAGGFQNQYGMETQIIAVIYGILAFAAINLAIKVPRIADPRAQHVAVLAWGAGIYILYSFLLKLFHIKNGNYPFYLPPF